MTDELAFYDEAEQKLEIKEHSDEEYVRFNTHGSVTIDSGTETMGMGEVTVDAKDIVEELEEDPVESDSGGDVQMPHGNLKIPEESVEFLEEDTLMVNMHD